MNNQTLLDRYNNLRAEIKKIGDELSKLKVDVINDNTTQFADKGEVIANVVLAFRHSEDARMRLGKAIENQLGGGSIYDKKPDTDMPNEPKAYINK